MYAGKLTFILFFIKLYSVFANLLKEFLVFSLIRCSAVHFFFFFEKHYKEKWARMLKVKKNYTFKRNRLKCSEIMRTTQHVRTIKTKLVRLRPSMNTENLWNFNKNEHLRLKLGKLLDLFPDLRPQTTHLSTQS